MFEHVLDVVELVLNPRLEFVEIGCLAAELFVDRGFELGDPVANLVELCVEFVDGAARLVPRLTYRRRRKLVEPVVGSG
jgi:hypothetical protein